QIDIFRQAYDIIGGGKFGDKYSVRTKEQADHSLPYLAAVAILDGDVRPRQFEPDRIARPDVHSLLKKVKCAEKRTYTWRYPKELDCRITVTLKDGRRLSCEKSDYEGFITRPMSPERIMEK